MNKISARDILKLLELRHANDIFIPECKTGSTWMTEGMVKLDAWVMPKSWAKFNTIGYEIKTSRSDFIKDEKWRSYLPYCHSFYFVCPPNLIKPEELSTDAGLMYTSVNASMIYTKKKAPFRDIEIPPSLFVYILMCRVAIGREYVNAFERIRAEAKERKYEGLWGRAYGKRLRRLIDEEIDKVRDENKRLRERIEYCEKIEKSFKDAGFDIDGYRWMIESRLADDIKRINIPFCGRLNGEIDNAIENLQKLKEVIGIK